MRVAVLSDTHLKAGKTLPGFVWENLTGVDLIIHAGDITNMDILAELACLAPVRAVRGNCDGWEVTLPRRDIVECEDCRIGVVHGNMGKGNSTPERAYIEFKDSNVDVIVFGHTHAPYLQRKDGILLFNPGSATQKRREAKHSFGLLDIQGKQVKAEHLYF